MQILLVFLYGLYFTVQICKNQLHGCQLYLRIRTHISVDSIPENRKPMIWQMIPDLMRPSGQYFQIYNSCLALLTYTHYFTDPNFRDIIRHFCMHKFLDIMRQLDAIEKFLSSRSNRYHSTIKLLERNRLFICKFFCSRFFLKKILKMSQSTFRFCNDHKAISTLIQSMQKPSSDKWSYARQILITMIQKTYHRRLFNIPHTIGMRKYSFWFIDDKIIIRFQHHGNINHWCLIQNRCIQISRDIINMDDITWFEFIRLFYGSSCYLYSSPSQDMMKKAPRVWKLRYQSSIYSFSSSCIGNIVHRALDTIGG